MDYCDGQTVKTRNLAALLGKDKQTQIVKVDTYLNRQGGFKNKIVLLLKSLSCLLRCNHIFLLVSEGGMRFYLPFLYYVNKVTRRRVYHYIIGSELLRLIDENPKLVKYLNALDVNWFEYESGTQYLREKGVANAETLANFKMITPVEAAVPYSAENGVFRFCTFSRVMEEKGITEAIKAVTNVNDAAGKTVATLDVYGPVDAGYADTFDRLLKENHSCVKYMGVADSGGSVEILKNYYALLFPTHWDGEGVPGTIIDAFASGLPVIASDWRANGELITAGVEGMIYPNADCEDLTQAVQRAVENAGTLAQMRPKSRAAFDQYTPETILQAIRAKMQTARE
nr:glycosyltransferase [Clostridia bacterium]